ncbi:hypothetical protein OEA41_009355 [Lepraria neglecta]|uniref:Protein kinase domain-containing protein n=1 Tax=Lepraria neglecta TaxID=209136 RepID=A0AAD9Z1N1_9LECA|nr:hypothetical protein OEA41_009355 [Lepraria neglecta]
MLQAFLLKVFEVFEYRDGIAMIMPRLELGSLALRIQKFGHFNRDDIKTITRQVLNALGIIHRDIKLENILIMCLDRLLIKVTDNGFSITAESNRGTHLFIEPENLMAGELPSIDSSGRGGHEGSEPSILVHLVVALRRTREPYTLGSSDTCNTVLPFPDNVSPEALGIDLFPNEPSVTVQSRKGVHDNTFIDHRKTVSEIIEISKNTYVRIGDIVFSLVSISSLIAGLRDKQLTHGALENTHLNDNVVIAPVAGTGPIGIALDHLRQMKPRKLVALKNGAQVYPKILRPSKLRQKGLSCAGDSNKELEGQNGLRKFHWLEHKSLEIQLQNSYEEVQSLRLQPDREIRYRDQVIACANEVRVRANDGWRTESSTTEEHSNPYVRAVRKKLWTEPRLTIAPLWSRTVKNPEVCRRGQQETFWGRQLRRVEPLPPWAGCTVT